MEHIFSSACLLKVLLVCNLCFVVTCSNLEKRLLVNDGDYVESRLHQIDVQIQTLMAQSSSKDQKIAQLTNRLNEKDAQIMNLTNQLKSLRLSGHPSQVVAFTALLNHSITAGAQQIIRYDTTLTNTGNAYDSTSGIFEVPVSGIYSLSASLMGDPHNGIHLQLVQNGKELVRLWTGGGDSYELASHTINVRLDKHDRIWVQNLHQASVYASEKYNIFSGVLLFEGQF
ncbi:cerebellin-1-like [Mytilus edulis]|uniref:cerebellin-1-like n=1 Tax=Mytilus edulis TaxID=6550 RepID=UPI0039F12F05